MISLKLKTLAAASALALATIAAPAFAADPESCKTVRFSDVGWTDIQVTTALTAEILKGLGYEPEIQVLTVPVTYTSLKNKDIDVFLGNWMPSMAADVDPYTKEGSVETIATNLEGAGYGLVVPGYVAEAGVKDLADVGKNKDKFDGKIYGIEPGNDGNRIVLGMIEDPANGLDGFELVESSEQGMLAQADRSMRANEWIVFLGWTPHPIMGKMGLHYLTGMGDTGFGSATVYTNVRAGYASECPNVGTLLKNLKFDLEMEGTMMDAVLTDGAEASAAALDWVKANPGRLDAWLAGVTTIDGGEALPAVKAHLGL
jgi:glycine betaine/proline transport system substrate-binding protein